MTGPETGRQWLARVWWVVAPAFALLVASLAHDRTCADPYELLPEIASRSGLAWPVALLYVGAHGWFVGAYLLTVAHAETVIPSPRAGRQFWGRHWPKVVATIAIFAVEYAPMPIWRGVRYFLNCQ